MYLQGKGVPGIEALAPSLAPTPSPIARYWMVLNSPWVWGFPPGEGQGSTGACWGPGKQ